MTSKIFLLILPIALVVNGCKRSSIDENLVRTKPQSITPQQAADQVKQSMNGLSLLLSSSTQALSKDPAASNKRSVIKGQTPKLGVARNFAVAGAECGKQGEWKYNYDKNYIGLNYSIVCMNGKTDSVSFGGIISFYYRDEHKQSDNHDGFAGQWGISNLTDSSRNWVYSGAVTDTLYAVSTVDSNAFSSMNMLSFSKVRFAAPNANYALGYVSAGNSLFHLTGSNSKGKYDYQGTIRFNNDATLTITILGFPFTFKQ